jgi:hypothetical protein
MRQNWKTTKAGGRKKKRDSQQKVRHIPQVIAKD